MFIEGDPKQKFLTFLYQPAPIITFGKSNHTDRKI
jgi:hypothetical protein